MNLAFIIIDDSELDCFVARRIIEQNSKSAKVTAYLDASVALRQIRENTVLYTEETTIILLDFRLPVMNGFEFMEEFQELPYSIQNKYIIYGLSSTINSNDISRMCNFKNVIKVLGKPLTTLIFRQLIAEVESMELG